MESYCLCGLYAKSEQQVAPPISHWPTLDSDCPDNKVCVDGVCIPTDKNFSNSDLVQTSRTRLRVLDASASWIRFERNWVREGDILHHANNNAIEILDDGMPVGGGIRYKFKAKPAVHADALRAGEEWWKITN